MILLNRFINSRFARLYMLVIMLFVVAATSFAQATLEPLDLDVNVFISSANNWMPVVLGIVAIGAGLAIAVKFANFIKDSLLSALGGSTRR